MFVYSVEQEKPGVRYRVNTILIDHGMNIIIIIDFNNLPRQKCLKVPEYGVH